MRVYVSDDAYVCPVCLGTGWDPDDPGGCASCYECGGRGVVVSEDYEDWGDEEE